MRSVKFVAAAGAVSLFSTMAFAADLPIAAPPVYVPPADFGGWYLRGDIGMTNQGLSRIDSNTAALFPLGGVGSDNSAWAARAGLAFRVTPSATLELARSYIDLESAGPGALTLFDGTTRTFSIVLRNMTPNDLTLGAHWSIAPLQVYAPPLVGKG